VSERQAQRERRRATLAQEEASRRLAAAAEAMERNELRRAQERFVVGVYQPQAVLAFPLLAYPVVVPPVVLVPRHPPAHGVTDPRRGYGRFLHRAPGSLLPPPGEPVVPPPSPISSSAKSSPAAGG
jgi:hypothetical protein